MPELVRRGLKPDAAVIGEPTGLEIAIAQKGLLIVELARKGRPCHAAHAKALGIRNPIADLAADLVAVSKVDLGPPHPLLGDATLEPTVVAGGSARNSVPAEATCILDLRTNPSPSHEELVARLQATGAAIRVVSDRLRPYAIDAGSPIVEAARRARPEAPLIGSRGVSDLVFFAAAGVPCVKVGPGRTERSHTANEFVLESEILDGARFYEQLALAYASLDRREKRVGRLWDRGEPLDELVLRFTAGEDHALDDRLVAYDVRASQAHARMLRARRPSERRGLGEARRGARGRSARRTSGASGRCRSRKRTATRRSRTASCRRSATRAAGSISAARATTRCSRRCGSG